MIEEQQLSHLIAGFQNLCDHLQMGEPPEDILYSYGGFFYIKNQDYQSTYIEFLLELLKIPKITEHWSEDGLKQAVDSSLFKVAEIKAVSKKTVIEQTGITNVAKELVDTLQQRFREREYSGFVFGLTLQIPLTIGHITFTPFQDKSNEFPGLDNNPHISDQRRNRYPIISMRIAAEERKALEVFQSKVIEALNALRFFGSLVWYDEPTHHIYPEGMQPKSRISPIISADAANNFIVQFVSNYSPLPFQVDEIFLAVANRYGLSTISNWLTVSNKTEFQTFILQAVQWIGEAVQDPNPKLAFMKYYISIESLLLGKTIKGKDESAKDVLPRRINFLLSRIVEKDEEHQIRRLIVERNSVFHTGLSKEDDLEILDHASRQRALHVVTRILFEAKMQNWQTKQDLIAWIEKEISD